MNKHRRADLRTCPLARSALQQLQENVSSICKPWANSHGKDQAHCGPFILRSCSHDAFIWLQVAVSFAACFLNNFTNQDETAHGELSQLREVNQSLPRHQVLR